MICLVVILSSEVDGGLTGSVDRLTSLAGELMTERTVDDKVVFRFAAMASLFERALRTAYRYVIRQLSAVVAPVHTQTR